MVEGLRGLANGIGALGAWLMHQAQLEGAQLSKKAKRRLLRGEVGARAQRRVDHAEQVRKGRVKQKARARRRSTRAMKQRVR